MRKKVATLTTGAVISGALALFAAAPAHADATRWIGPFSAGEDCIVAAEQAAFSGAKIVDGCHVEDRTNSKGKPVHGWFFSEYIKD